MASQAELGEQVGESFLVRPRLWQSYTQLLMVAGVILIGISAIVMFCEGPMPVVAGMLAAGALLSIVAGTIVLIRRGKGWHITEHKEGVALERGPIKLVCAFAEMVALGKTVKQEFTNGIFAGVDHQVRIWRKGDPIATPFLDIHVFCKTETAEAGRLADLIELITKRVVAHISDLIGDGGTAKAPGIQLSRSELVIHGEAVPLEDIAATGLHEDKLCIWRHGEEHPAFRLDPALPNIVPIVAVLDTELERRAEASQKELDGLGRILFERRASKALMWILLILGLGTAIFLVGLVLLLVAAILFRSRFRCHERGVYCRGLFKEKRLEYRDVAMFSYATTRHYYNGVYTGTSVRMKMKPEETPPGLPTITFSRTVRNLDSDLDVLRDRVANVIGGKLLIRLAETGEATWTPDVSFNKEGIRFREHKLIGKGDWRQLPYEQISGSTMQNGIFHLFAKGEEKSLLRTSVAADNFFPGLHVLAKITGPMEANDGESLSDAGEAQ